MARRPPREGSITHHRIDRDGRDVWLLRWYAGRDATGRKRYGSTLFHGTYAEAQAKLRELLARRDKGEPLPSGPETLGAFLDRWLRDYKGPLSPTTRAGYLNVVENHLKPALGGLYLHRITPQDLQRYYAAKQAAGLSPTTVAQHARILHAAFRAAMKEGKLGVNPVDLTEPPKAEDYQATVWTREQALRFLEVAEPSDPEHPKPADRYYALWVLLIATGLRIGEALALTWDRVFLDADPPYLLVRQSHYEITKKEAAKLGLESHRGTKAPKAKKSLRPVVLDSRTAEALRRHKAQQDKEKEVLGDRYHDQGRVFATVDGRTPYRSNVYEHFVSLIEAAGLPRIRLHDLRHTHDTHLKQAGVHPRDQQDRLGHATLAMTERYTHVLTPDQIEAARKWEAFFYGPAPQKPKPPKARKNAERGGGASR